MTKIFKVPFAEKGDKIPIPNQCQDNGDVSYSEGYGKGYGFDPNENPLAKNIEREKMNGLFHDITEAVGEMQTFGVAQWSSDAQPYPLRGLVYHKQKLWQSRIENNKEEPNAGNVWMELKADLTAADVGAYSKDESDARFQGKGDYATNASLSGKLDKSAIVQTTGQSTNQIMSQKAVTEALSHAVSIDVLYPVGIILWFAQNKNPNHLFPGTTWKYIGENRTVRLAASNGSDVLSIGGSDSITLAVAEIPVHSHSFSGSTSDFDYGTMETDEAGTHNHVVDGMGAPGDEGLRVSTTSGGSYTFHSPSTDYEGSHTHYIELGHHKHTFSGTTQNTGSNRAVNITNSFIKLMGWYRSA